MSFQVEIAHDSATAPTRMTEGAAGYDMYSCESITIAPHMRTLVSTGLKMTVPQGTYGRVAPRSSMACKGVDVGAGVIDADYQGIVKVLLINNSNEPFSVNIGDRIAQLLLEQIVTPEVTLVSKLADTKRGAGGFGSTGA